MRTRSWVQAAGLATVAIVSTAGVAAAQGGAITGPCTVTVVGAYTEAAPVAAGPSGGGGGGGGAAPVSAARGGGAAPNIPGTNMTLAEAAAAHEHLETSERTGKVLLVP